MLRELTVYRIDNENIVLRVNLGNIYIAYGFFFNEYKRFLRTHTSATLRKGLD